MTFKPGRIHLIGLALFLITAALYLPATGFDFILLDDGGYVYDNPHVKFGFTRQGVIWALLHDYASNWHPVTWWSHMLDCQLYGLNAGGHHLTSVFLHAGNTVLLFLLLRKLTGVIWR